MAGCMLFCLIEKAACSSNWFGSSDSSSSSCSMHKGSSWSTQEVVEWVKSLGKPFEQYAQAFDANAIDGTMLADFDEQTLKDDFGINSKFHLKKMLNTLDSLKAQCTNPAAVREERINAIPVADVIGKKEGELIGSLSEPVFEALCKAGVPVDDSVRIIGEDLNNVLYDIMQQVVRLEAAEKQTHFTIHQTATVLLPSDGGHAASLVEGAKVDLPQIMNSKRATRSAFYELKSGVGKLVTAIRAYTMAGSQGLSRQAMKSEFGLLKENFRQWHKTAGETMQKLFDSSAELHQRAEMRMKEMQVGGSAVQGNLKALAQTAQDLQNLNQKRRQVIDSDRKDVQLALIARGGAMDGKLLQLDGEIAQTEHERAQLVKLVGKKDDMVQSVEEFIMQQNNKKQEWRDWHIRYWWADRWGPEMNTYDQQADENIASQERVRIRAEHAKSLLGDAIEKYDQVIARKQEEKSAMVIAKNTWNHTLNSEGLTSLELQIKAKNEQLHNAQQTLANAMQIAGVSDPEAAAKAIATSHRASMLIAGAASKSHDVAHRVKAWQTRFDPVLERLLAPDAAPSSVDLMNEHLQLVAKSMRLIGDGYEHRIKKLDDGESKHALIDSFLLAETGGQRVDVEQQLPSASQ